MQFRFEQKPTVIAVAGPKGSGKSFAAAAMMYMFNGRKPLLLHFGDHLKVICSRTFDVPIAHFHTEALKEAVLPQWGMSPRDMMTSMADIIRARYGDDFFVRVIKERAQQELSKGNVVLIGDLRHKPEVDWIRANNFHVIHVVGNSGLYAPSTHESEVGVTQVDTDHVVLNDFTSALTAQLGSALVRLGFKPI